MSPSGCFLSWGSASPRGKLRAFSKPKPRPTSGSTYYRPYLQDEESETGATTGTTAASGTSEYQFGLLQDEFGTKDQQGQQEQVAQATMTTGPAGGGATEGSKSKPSRKRKAEDHQSQPSYQEETGSERDENKPARCVFCNEVLAERNGEKFKCQYVTDKDDCGFKLIIDYASQMYRLALLEAIQRAIEECECVPYHVVCRNDFMHDYQDALEKERTTRYAKRDFHRAADEGLDYFIKENVLDTGDVLDFGFVKELYRQYLFEEFNYQDLPVLFYTCTLEAELIERFRNEIQIKEHRERSLLMPIGADLQTIDWQKFDKKFALKSAAVMIRHEILSIKRIPLPENPTAEELVRGECEIPPMLKSFVTHLLTGEEPEKENDLDTRIRIKTMCEDMIYAVTDGRIRPSKQMDHGMVFHDQPPEDAEVTNDYGYSAPHEDVEDLESKASNLNIDSKFILNNFDKYVECFSKRNSPEYRKTQTPQAQQPMYYQDLQQPGCSGLANVPPAEYSAENNVFFGYPGQHNMDVE